MKYAIFYEHAERELKNAYLLKCELIRRGHEAFIFNIDYLHKTKQKLKYKPDVIIVPYLYYSRDVKFFKSVFLNEVDKIVNLQYEQIISKRWEKVGFHNPKDLAVNGIHLCWSKETKDRIVENGVPEENAIIVGCINLDMDSEKFRGIYKNKEEMSSKYNLNSQKDWILFISNFSSNKNREKDLKFKFGEENASEVINTTIKSKAVVLQWIEDFVKENDCEYIYRPHPAELLDEDLINLSEKHKNFHVIKNDCVRSWISVSDKINIWKSSSISDVYFMKKDCIVLRPIDIAEDFDAKIYLSANKVKTYEEFSSFNKNPNQKYNFPIKEEEILKFFHIDKEKYSYERICDVLENISDKEDNKINMTIEDVISTYDNYNKEDDNNIINQYNNAFFLRNVREVLLHIKFKDMRIVIDYLKEFVEAKKYYSDLESYKELEEKLTLLSFRINKKGICEIISKLIYEIEVENNQYILNYNYIEDKLNSILKEDK